MSAAQADNTAAIGIQASTLMTDYKKGYDAVLAGLADKGKAEDAKPTVRTPNQIGQDFATAMTAALLGSPGKAGTVDLTACVPAAVKLSSTLTTDQGNLIQATSPADKVNAKASVAQDVEQIKILAQRFATTAELAKVDISASYPPKQATAWGAATKLSDFPPATAAWVPAVSTAATLPNKAAICP